MTNQEYVCKLRGFGPITSDEQLIAYAEEQTRGWYDAGWHRTFATYYLGDQPSPHTRTSNFSAEEFKRLKELQAKAIEDLKAVQAKYDYENYRGRQMTEEEVTMFLDRLIQKEEKQWGTDYYYTERARKYKEETLEKFRRGEVVLVDSYCYTAPYGRGTGDYSKVLYSDGHIETVCYGGLD